MSGGEINPTELVATLINQEATFEDGIRHAQELIEGSCSMLLLTDGRHLRRPRRLGRTPVTLGQKGGRPRRHARDLRLPEPGLRDRRATSGPARSSSITAGRRRARWSRRGDALQICSFLWVYYGYPASSYEGINVEAVRNRCGAALARPATTCRSTSSPASPTPASGTRLGYATEAGIPYRRPFVKYTPTWPRSFMPQDQDVRDLVARMKLIPIRELIQGKRLLFCEDSIVRGTQLTDTIQRLYDYGRGEVHMRPACPPLVYGCKFLNFSRSRSETRPRRPPGDRGPRRPGAGDLAEIHPIRIRQKYRAMVERIARKLGLTTLRYQRLEDLVAAIGLPKEKLCTYCWDGEGTD